MKSWRPGLNAEDIDDLPRIHEKKGSHSLLKKWLNLQQQLKYRNTNVFMKIYWYYIIYIGGEKRRKTTWNVALCILFFNLDLYQSKNILVSLPFFLFFFLI